MRKKKIKHGLHSRAKLKTISVTAEVIFSSPHSLNKGYTPTYSDIGQHLLVVVSEEIMWDECAATPHLAGRVLGT